MSLLAGALWLDGATRTPATLAPNLPVTDCSGQHVDAPAAFTWDLPALTPESRREPLPIVSADQRWVVTYSGRIDNRDELIARYGARAEASDGELLTVAVERDGSQGWRHAIGDFVIAAWDREHRAIVLARDAIGHRPLFYAREAGRVLWSTNFRDLSHRLSTRPAPNAGFLAECLSGAVASLDETVLTGVFRLPPSTVLTIPASHGQPTFTTLWQPPTSLPPRRTDDDLIAELSVHLDRAVRECVRGGRVACELSGGLDSTTLLALATEQLGSAPATYSIVYPGAPFAPHGDRLDESGFIDTATRRFGAASTRFDPRAFASAATLRVMHAHGDLPDWPNADFMRWPMVSAAAADGHRVVLTGVGGDQWLTGTSARLPALLQRGRFVEAYRFYRAAQVRPGMEASARGLLRHVVSALTPRGVARAYRLARSARPWPAWITPRFARAAGLEDRLARLTLRMPKVGDPVLRDSLMRFAGAEGAAAREGIFRSADDAGVEARHPFFDRRVVEFVMTLPDDLRFRDGQTRFILRRAMAARLPTEIASRRDKGDGDMLTILALSRLLRDMDLRSWRLADAGWVDGDALRAASAAFLATNPWVRPPSVADHRLWDAVSVELWLRAREAVA